METKRLKNNIRKKTSIFLMVIFCLFFNFMIPIVTASSVPTILSYQGRLSDIDGNLLGGAGTTYYLKLSFWDSSVVGGGNKVWPSGNPTTFSTTVRHGLFNVNIGDTANGYPDTLNYDFSSNDRIYLQIQISSDGITFETLSPRQPITSSAFAQVSGSVVGNNRLSTFGTLISTNNSTVTISATGTDNIPLTIYGVSGQNANLFQLQTTLGNNVLYINKSGGLFASSTLAVSGPVNFYSDLSVAGSASTTNSFNIGSLLGLGGQYFSSLLGLGLKNDAGLLAVNTSTLGLNADQISEGSTNKFWTLDNFSNALAGTTTDALAQGLTNKYYSSLLFASDLAGTTTDALAEGLTNKYYNDSLVASYLTGSTTLASFINYWTKSGSALSYTSGDVSVADLIVNNSITLGGVSRTTWPSVSTGTGGGSFWATSTDNLVGYPDLTGDYAIVIGSAATSSDVRFEVNGNSKLGGNLLISSSATTTGSFNIGSLLGLGGQYFSSLLGLGLKNDAGLLAVNTSTLGLNADQISEGSTNKFWTLDNFSNALAGTTTDALAQGLTNKYYSSLLFATDLAGTTTDALAEGLTNKYYNDSLVASYLTGSTTLASFINYWTKSGDDLIYEAGKIGIATSTPNYELSVGGDFYLTGNIGVGLSPSTSSALSISKTYTDLTNSLYGAKISTILNPDGNSIVPHYGAYVENVASSTGDYGGNIFGLASYGNHSGSGTVENLYGVLGGVKKTGYGNISNAYGVLASLDNSADSGVITNGYGLFIASSTGVINNSYALYADGAGSKNYFAGKVGIGTNAPGSSLDINSNSPNAHSYGYGFNLSSTKSANWQQSLGRFNLTQNVGTGDTYSWDATAQEGIIQHTGAGTSVSLVGGNYKIGVGNGGTISNATALQLTTPWQWDNVSSAPTGNITNLYGLSITAAGPSGTNVSIANNYGIYINSPTIRSGVSVTGNNYALYSASSVQKSYFAGNVGIGDSTPLQLFTVGNGEKFTIDASGNATSSGYLTIGTAPIGSNFTSGSVNIQNSLVVGGNSSISGNLAITGTSVFTGAISGAGFTSSFDDRLSTVWRGQVNGVASLGADGKVPDSQLSPLAITDTHVVASEVEMLALPATVGDVAVRTDISRSYILRGADPSVLSNWTELVAPTDSVISVNGQTGSVTLSSDDISEGLTNFYFTASRFDDRINSVWRAQPNGLASLGADGKIPTDQLGSLPISETHVVSSESAMLALSAGKGDLAVRTDESKTYVLQGTDPSVLANWVELLNGASVVSVNGLTGSVSLTSTNISEGSNLYWTQDRFNTALSSATIWDGDLFVNTGNVGINISNPSQALEVVGNASTTGHVYVGGDLHVGYANGSNSDAIYFNQGLESLVWSVTNNRFEFSDNLYISGNATSSGNINLASANPLLTIRDSSVVIEDTWFDIYNGNTSVLKIKSWDGANRVGIVTEDNLYFSVPGSTTFINSGGTIFSLAGDPGDTHNFQAYNGNFEIRTTGPVGGYTPGYISFSPGDSEAMRIDGLGKIGIGTDTPLSKFNIEINSDGTQSYLTLSDTDIQVNDRKRIAWDHNSGTTVAALDAYSPASDKLDLRFSTYDSGLRQDIVTFSHTGNVGIGTTTPDALLQVGNATQFFKVSSLGNVSNTGSLTVTGDISGNNLSGTNTGNVTLAGENYLSISGQQITTNKVDLASHITGTLGIANGGTGKTSFTAGQLLFGEFAQDSGLFWNNTTKRLAVGGQTNPSQTLEIGDGTNANFALGFTGNRALVGYSDLLGGNRGVVIASLGSDRPIRLSSNSTDTAHLSIVAGNVGIGTGITAPAAKLDVVGSIKTSVGLNASGADVGTSFQGRSDWINIGTDAAGYGHLLFWSNIDSAGAWKSKYGTSNNIRATRLRSDANGIFRIDAATGVTAINDTVTSFTPFLIDYSGNVGIGDTTPASLLTVGSGDKFQVDTNGNIIKINNVTYSWPAAIGTAGQALTISNAGTGALAWSTITSTAGGWTDDDTTVRLTAASDNVAIGTNTAEAGYKLTIKGNVILSNDDPVDTYTRIITTESVADMGGELPYLHITTGDDSGGASARGGDVRIFGGDVTTANLDGNVILAYNGTSAVGKVGIGKTAPAYTLDINGTIRSTGAAYFDELFLTGASTITTPNNDPTPHLTITAGNNDSVSGNVYIHGNYNTPYVSGRVVLAHNGSTQIGGVTVGGTTLDSNYVFQVVNSSSLKAKAYAWDTYSDSRIKDNQRLLEYGLDQIMALQPKRYLQRDSEFSNGELVLSNGAENIGLIAQEVYEIIPEIVQKPNNDKEELWGLNYSGFVPVIIKAIQEQQQKILDLTNLFGGGLTSSGNISSLFAGINIAEDGSIQFNGHVYFDKDSAGVVRLAKGSTEVIVTFDKPYAWAPVIIVTPRGRLAGREYWVDNETTTGFRISIDSPLDQEIDFSWQAIASKDAFTNLINETEVQTPVIIDNTPTSTEEIISLPVDNPIEESENSDLIEKEIISPLAEEIENTDFNEEEPVVEESLVDEPLEEVVIENTEVVVGSVEGAE